MQRAFEVASLKTLAPGDVPTPDIGDPSRSELSINHPILAAIRYWACRVADAFDDDDEDNELGLDSAIMLLKVRYALDIVEHG